MKKENNHQPSEAELEILQVLWSDEPMTVKELHERIDKGVGYTTTLKQVQRMFDKKMVEREENTRPHLYRSVIRESQVKRSLFDRLLNTVFKGSAVDLIQHALGNTDPDPEEIKALERLIQQQKEKDKDD